ncbi:hypothetical protein FIE12Z_8724 [Fusarium flagelliforme]|uniref:Uncharacterized protein n=1 Tax=Fusarium flagelliforme TaxID=2675880 RepID=A0A395MGE7_9HYPO|nr:hypothetical protein FIE12Z_8724 [Fusarium flagelliforme]
MPSEQAQHEAAKKPEAPLYRRHSRSTSEPHAVKTELNTSSKGKMKPKNQFQSAPSDTFITAEGQVKRNKTGHQLMSMGDVEREWRDRYKRMTEEEREAESNKYINPEFVKRAQKGVSPAVAMKYLMDIYGSIQEITN